MVFSSFLFLFFFLPAFFTCYFLSPPRLKNLMLLAWSFLFYAWGAPKLIGIFFLSTVLDYFLGRAISASRTNGPWRKCFLYCSLLINLGALLYFKYANFFIADLERLFHSLGWGGIDWAPVALPVGISFFTFHKISYTVDVYRGAVLPARSFINYALYIALFPQLIAGPIIRYHDIAQQIASRRHTLERFFDGMCRFCIGLAKKVLIADAMGNVTDNIFRLGPNQLTTGWAWLGIACYAYQIYFDFSGYSDMAIGLGRVMGFDFLENFDRPYIAQNFTEFWRRWHISLSRWMRDYLYIPLGGNRVSAFRTYVNLWIVFLLSGLWHGASWTFVVWGLYHGFFLMLDRLFWLRLSARLPQVLNTAITFILVLVGWVFFRSKDFLEASDYLTRMFNVFEYGERSQHVLRAAVMHNQAVFVFAVATLICFAPVLPSPGRLSQLPLPRFTPAQAAWGRFSLSAACLLLSAIAISAADYSPFIYFRF